MEFRANIIYNEDKSLFADDGRKEEREGAGVAEPDEDDQESVVFAIYLHDPLHSLSFSTLSQAVPAKWAQWLDANPKDSGLPECRKPTAGA